MRVLIQIYLTIILPIAIGFYAAMAMGLDTASFEENTQRTSEWWIHRHDER